MANGKSTWKYNKLLTARRNYFSPGGPISASIPGNMMNNINANDVQALKQQYMADTSNSQLSGQTWGTSYDTLEQEMAYTPALGHVDKYDLGAKSNMNIFGNSLIEGLKGSVAGFSAGGGGFAAYGGPIGKKYMGGGPIGAIVGGVLGTGMSLIGDLIHNRKAAKAAGEVNDYRDYVNNYNDRLLATKGENLADLQANNLLRNYTGASSNMFNSAAFGGELNVHGSDFTNGLLNINAGGSHEENPYEGVLMGIDNEGTPNLVEEGETIFNDYVFSQRIKVPRGLRGKYKLGGPLSFADASKKLAKESEERPNDPISKNGLEYFMGELAQAQEEVKQRQQLGEMMANVAAYGGKVNKFSTGGSWAYNNTANTDDMAGHEIFAPFFKDGSFDFNAMYADNSEYRKRLDKVVSALYKRKVDKNYQYTEDEKKILNSYISNIAKWNNGKSYDNIDLLSFDKIVGDMLTTDDEGKTFKYNSSGKKKGLALDGLRGGHHFGVIGDDLSDPRKQEVRRFLRTVNQPDANGTPPAEPYTYEDITSKYNANDPLYKYIETKNIAEGDTDYTDYYYETLPEAGPVNNPKNQVFYNIGTKRKPNYILYNKDDWETYMPNNGFFRSRTEDNDIGGQNYYYDIADKPRPTWMRETPLWASGIRAITDAFGLTGQADYSQIPDLVTRTPQIGFTPNGNYLTYTPYDTYNALNQLNAASGATRRAQLQNAGLNRGLGAAALLATDNNYVNGIGTNYAQALDYNTKQRQAVEDFNRATNQFNSNGALSADQANMNAIMQGNQLYSNNAWQRSAAMNAERIRAYEDRQATLNTFLESMQNYGLTNENLNSRDALYRSGVVPQIAKELEKWYGVSRAKGGKINKKRKGLTF